MSQNTKKQPGPRTAIIGTGYVGLSTAVAFADRGIPVICVDIVREKIALINQGKSPIFEIGMDKLLISAVNSGMLTATHDTKKAVSESDVIFICVQTPSLPSGEIGLKYIQEAAVDIGKALASRGKRGYPVIVVKSTVLPGTTEGTVLPLLEKYSGMKSGVDFGISMCPEFLREGNAIRDTEHPDRIVIGPGDEKSWNALEGIYSRFDAPILRTEIRVAEMIKYASNAFLAAKISFANELAIICEIYGIDVYEVMKGVGMDSRIGPQFLNAGVGFGGSCFPKDTKALLASAERLGHSPRILRAVMDVNDRQAIHLVNIVQEAIGSLEGTKVALLGLAFKPDTDDVRETRAYPIARELLRCGADVVAYDPMAMNTFRKGLHIEGLKYAPDLVSALKGADCCIIQTEWEEFKAVKPAMFKKVMRRPLVVDGRRTYEPGKLISAGVDYRGIGWKKNK